MHSSGRLRRTVAITACGGLASALAWLPAGPAASITPVQVYIAQGASKADPGCTVTSGSSSTPFNPKNLHHGSAKGGVNLITTWTNGSNSADVVNVTGHYAGSAHLAKHNGAFTKATVSGSGHISIIRAIGGASTCAVSAQILNAIEFVSTQPAGWYYVTRSTTKSSLTEMVVSRDLTLVHPVIFEAYQGGRNTVTQRAFVSKGQYITLLAAGIEAGDYPVLVNSKTANTNTSTAVFRKAGSALNGAKGSAGHFVKFPGAVSCAHHSAKLTWRGSASRVAAGAFYVNGKKKASASNPKSGHSVVLRHLGKTADNKITAKLSLTSGGKATASDLYVPCHD